VQPVSVDAFGRPRAKLMELSPRDPNRDGAAPAVPSFIGVHDDRSNLVIRDPPLPCAYGCMTRKIDLAHFGGRFRWLLLCKQVALELKST